MWIVVYIAKTKKHAVSLSSALENVDIITHIRPVNKGKQADDYYEILVPQTEIYLAQPVIIENNY